jgi:hypothetical protein
MDAPPGGLRLDGRHVHHQLALVHVLGG